MTSDIIKVPLTKEQFAFVDLEDFELIKDHSWYAFKAGKCFYAATRTKGKIVLMHVLIMGKELGKEIDHVDGNGLNNTRENLRHLTHSQNIRKGSAERDGVGVHFRNDTKKWTAKIRLKLRMHYSRMLLNKGRSH